MASPLIRSLKRPIVPTPTASTAKNCAKYKKRFVYTNQSLARIRISELARLEEHPVKDENQEYWKQLCERAAVEQDPERLLELIQVINRMLDEKEPRSQHEQSASDGV